MESESERFLVFYKKKMLHHVFCVFVVLTAVASSVHLEKSSPVYVNTYDNFQHDVGSHVAVRFYLFRRDDDPFTQIHTTTTESGKVIM